MAEVSVPTFAALFAAVWKYSNEWHAFVQQSKQAPARILSIYAHLESCWATLGSLHRIHILEFRLDENAEAHDPFALRNILDTFSQTCQTLEKKLLPYRHSSGRIKRGLLFNLRWNWNIRDIKELEEDILKHQTTLNSCLTKAIYVITRRTHDMIAVSDARRESELEIIHRTLERIEASTHVQHRLPAHRSPTPKERQGWEERIAEYSALLRSTPVEIARAATPGVFNVSGSFSRRCSRCNRDSPQPQDFCSPLSIAADEDYERPHESSRLNFSQTIQSPVPSLYIAPSPEWRSSIPSAHSSRRYESSNGRVSLDTIPAHSSIPIPQALAVPRYIRTDDNRLIEQQTASGNLRLVKSDNIIDATAGMTDEQSRIFIAGHLNGIDVKVAGQVYRSASMGRLELPSLLPEGFARSGPNTSSTSLNSAGPRRSSDPVKRDRQLSGELGTVVQDRPLEVLDEALEIDHSIDRHRTHVRPPCHVIEDNNSQEVTVKQGGCENGRGTGKLRVSQPGPDTVSERRPSRFLHQPISVHRDGMTDTTLSRPPAVNVKTKPSTEEIRSRHNQSFILSDVSNSARRNPKPSHGKGKASVELSTRSPSGASSVAATRLRTRDALLEQLMVEEAVRFK